MLGFWCAHLKYIIKGLEKEIESKPSILKDFTENLINTPTVKVGMLRQFFNIIDETSGLKKSPLFYNEFLEASIQAIKVKVLNLIDHRSKIRTSNLDQKQKKRQRDDIKCKINSLNNISLLLETRQPVIPIEKIGKALYGYLHNPANMANSFPLHDYLFFSLNKGNNFNHNNISQHEVITKKQKVSNDYFKKVPIQNDRYDDQDAIHLDNTRMISSALF